MAEQDKASPLGLYVHVPFCASTCDFCAFYQVQPTAGGIDRYIAGIEREMALVQPGRRFNTIFWGGGTPGLLSPADLRRLGSIVGRPLADRLTPSRHGVPQSGTGPTEWTVELAPAFVTRARLDALREVGVTRISLGIQSFDEDRLVGLGRQHTASQARRAFAAIREAGFDNVNIDLMFALPGQTAADWANDLAAGIALGPDHISTYCLTLEEDTKLWLRLAAENGRHPAGRDPTSRSAANGGTVPRCGMPSVSGPDAEAAMYEAGWAQLERAGFRQYEVSNFARPGHACLHNLNTWRMNEWIGLGPSAASQFGGSRGANVADLDRWLADLAAGRRAEVDRVDVTPRLRAEDALIFGLRMNEGVELDSWRAVDPEAPWPAVERILERLVDAGLAVGSGERERPGRPAHARRYCLTSSGRLLADAVGAEIMEAFSEPAATR